ERTMLFVNTKRFAERLVSNLERHGFRIGALTGDIPQPRRLKILQDFRSGVLPLLVATDVASRGLHIDGVTHVINVDLPQDPEDYVHRIGRTARAGQSGKAISLADEDYVFSLDAIQRLIGMKIPVEHPDEGLFASAGSPPNARAAAPPAPTAPSARAAAPPAPAMPLPAPPPHEESELEEAAAAPGIAVDRPHVSIVGLEGADFWTREAFGLEMPHGGFGAEPVELSPPSSAAPAKRRRRRRGRRVAGRVEAAAPA
ncbi:MAG: helicase-related protein, partial [Thermoanaerobaculia bacterium]